MVNFIDILKANNANYQISSLNTCSELLLVHEVHKYLKLEAKENLSLGTLKVTKAVGKTAYFSLLCDLVEDGFDFGIYSNVKAVKSLPDDGRAIKTFDASSVTFARADDEEAVFVAEETEIENSQIMLCGDTAFAYLSLFARVLVDNYLEKKTRKFVIDHAHREVTKGEYNHLIILMDWGNRIVTPDCIRLFYNVQNNKRGNREITVQPDWEAYCAMQQQLGFMVERTDAIKKGKAAKKLFVAGDVVLLYERNTQYVTNPLSRLDECYAAVIGEVTGTHITLVKLLTSETKLSRQKRIRGYSSGLFTKEDENATPGTASVTYSYHDIGIAQYTYDEFRFILLPHSAEYTDAWIPCGGQEHLVCLNTVELLYAILESHGYAYDKQKYLDRHFKGGKLTPVYDSVISGMYNY